MKRAHIILAIIASFGLAGCSTSVNRSQMSTSLDVNMESNLTADIEVDLTKQLKGTAKQSMIFWFFDLDVPEYFTDGVSYNRASNQSSFSMFSPTNSLMDSVKSAAAYRATYETKADVLVFPQYSVKMTSRFMGFYKEVVANVYGYAGNIKSIKPTDSRKKAEIK